MKSEKQPEMPVDAEQKETPDAAAEAAKLEAAKTAAEAEAAKAEAAKAEAAKAEAAKAEAAKAEAAKAEAAKAEAAKAEAAKAEAAKAEAAKAEAAKAEAFAEPPADAFVTGKNFISEAAARLAGEKRCATGQTVETGEVAPGYWKWWIPAARTRKAK